MWWMRFTRCIQSGRELNISVRVKDKQTINIYKPWETLWNSVKIWTFHNFNLLRVFKNRLQICKPRIWKSQIYPPLNDFHRPKTIFVDPLILGSWQLHKHSEVSQTSVSCFLQFHYCYLLISILISLDVWEGPRNNMIPTKFQGQVFDVEKNAKLPRDHLFQSPPKGKTWKNYNKTLEKFP